VGRGEVPRVLVGVVRVGRDDDRRFLSFGEGRSSAFGWISVRRGGVFAGTGVLDRLPAQIWGHEPAYRVRPVVQLWNSVRRSACSGVAFRFAGRGARRLFGVVDHQCLVRVRFASAFPRVAFWDMRASVFRCHDRIRSYSAGPAAGVARGDHVSGESSVYRCGDRALRA